MNCGLDLTRENDPGLPADYDLPSEPLSEPFFDTFFFVEITSIYRVFLSEPLAVKIQSSLTPWSHPVISGGFFVTKNSSDDRCMAQPVSCARTESINPPLMQQNHAENSVSSAIAASIKKRRSECFDRWSGTTI